MQATCNAACNLNASATQLCKLHVILLQVAQGDDCTQSQAACLHDCMQGAYKFMQVALSIPGTCNCMQLASSVSAAYNLHATLAGRACKLQGSCTPHTALKLHTSYDTTRPQHPNRVQDQAKGRGMGEPAQTKPRQDTLRFRGFRREG